MFKEFLIAEWQKIELLSFEPFQISRAPKLPPSPSNACHAGTDTFSAIFVTIMYCFNLCEVSSNFSQKMYPNLLYAISNTG